MSKNASLAILAVVVISILIGVGFRYYNRTAARPAATSLVPTPTATTSTAPNAAQSATIATTTNSQNGAGAEAASSFSFINPSANSFSIGGTGLSFSVKKIVRAAGDVIAETGCVGKPSEAFLQYLYFGSSGVCINTFSIENKTALVAIDVEATNNSETYPGPLVIGNFMQLLYTTNNNGQFTTHTAEAYLPLSSHYLSPLSKKTVRIGFVVPADQNEFQLTYGYAGGPYPGESTFAQPEGSFNINFSDKSFVETPG